jgi:peptidoglycan hydrolase-like protein with peptidoglycan-binding domain
MGSSNPDRPRDAATATAGALSNEALSNEDGDRPGGDALATGSSPARGSAGSSRRALRLAAATAIVLAIVAAVAVVLLDSSSSPRDTAGTGVPAGQTTAEVTRRTLTESSTVDGTLGYGATLELYDRLSGTFTWLPAVGATIGRGGTLWRIDNQPVALMYGSVPAYRTLKKGVSDGPDLTELNQNLIDLGYDPYGAIADDEDFSEATAAAVRRWQHAEGLPETGEVELGRIVFAPGARRVTAVKVALGQDPPGGAGAKEPASEDQGSKEPPSEKPSLKEPASKAPASKAPDSEKPGPEKPASKEPGSKKAPASKVPSSKKPIGKETSKEPAAKDPASKEPSSKEPSSKEPSSTKGEDEPGAGAGAGMVVLGTTSTQQLVTLKLKAEQQTLARVGEVAPVTLPGGRVVQGRIVEVGSVAEAKESASGEKGGGSGGESESPTITVTLALEHPVAHLDEAPVSVELVKSIRHEVLTVPATALTATAGGGYAIATLQNGRRVALTVTPGMFADGNVQVEGPGVREGLTVIESE